MTSDYRGLTLARIKSGGLRAFFTENLVEP